MGTHEDRLESGLDEIRGELLRLLQNTHQDLLECGERERATTDAPGGAGGSGGYPPPCGEPRQAPRHREGDPVDALEELRIKGVIEPVKSPLCSPIVLPKRAESGVKLRVNLLGLNSHASWEDETEEPAEDELSPEQYFLQNMYSDASMRYMMGELPIRTAKPRPRMGLDAASYSRSWWEDSEDEHDHQVDEVAGDRQSPARAERTGAGGDFLGVPETHGPYYRTGAWGPSDNEPRSEWSRGDHRPSAAGEPEEDCQPLEWEESDDDWYSCDEDDDDTHEIPGAQPASPHYPGPDPEAEDTRHTSSEQVRADRRGRTAPTGNGNRATEGAERAEDPGNTQEPVGEEDGPKGVRGASENTAGGPPARKRTRIAPPGPGRYD